MNNVIFRLAKSFLLWSLLSLSSIASALHEGPSVKVGIAASLTGVYQEQGASLLKGLKMWGQDINARGALLGRRVEIIHYDDQSDPKKSAELYEKMIKEDGVDLLVGPYASNLTMSAAKVAEQYQFPMVSGTAAATSIWSQGYRYIFQVDVPAPFYMEGGLRIAKKGGVERVGIVYQNNLFTKEVAMGAKRIAEELGLSVVVYQSYNQEETDFSSLIKTLEDFNVEALFGASYLDDSVAMVKEAKKQGFSPKSIAFTSGPSLQAFGEQLGADAEGIIGFTPWIRSGHQPMAFDFDFRYSRLDGHHADSNAAGGYAAGEVLEAAVRLANSLDREAVRKQLSEMTFVSIMGRYDVDKDGRQIGKQMYMIQWQDGRRRLVLPDRFAETKSRKWVPWDMRN